MCLSQWGVWSDELEIVQLGELVEAYTVRQMFLANLQATLLIRALATALGSGAHSDAVVPVSEILAMMGVEIGGQTS